MSGTHTVEIEATRERCLALLLDAERLPDWYPTLDEVAVLERDGEQRPALLRSQLAAGPLGTLEVLLRQRYALPERVDAEQVGGDGRVERIEYRWRLEALAAGRTRASYRFTANAGGWAVRLALRAARPLVERDLVRGFPEALRIAAEAPPPTPPRR